MSTTNLVIGVALVLVVWFLANKMRILGTHERFAVFRMGEFERFIGPGLLFRYGGHATEWVRIGAGDRGLLVHGGLAKFGDRHIPSTLQGDGRPGAAVRVVEFTTDAAVVALDADQTPSYVCEKCGHENRLV